MKAKVELVCGQENRQCMRKTSILEDLKFWIEPAITLSIEYSDHRKEKIIRLLIFCCHPEHYFKNTSSGAAVIMDTQLAVGSDMAKLDRTVEEKRFFTRRSRVYSYNDKRKASRNRKRKSNGKLTASANPKPSM